MIHRPLIFVAMPNDGLFEDWWTYLIQPIAHELGAQADRVRFKPRSENVLRQIFERIEMCHVFVALAIDRNPNVYLEVGYALARNKKTTIVATDHRTCSFFAEFATVIESRHPDALTMSALAHQLQIDIETTFASQSLLVAE